LTSAPTKATGWSCDRSALQGPASPSCDLGLAQAGQDVRLEAIDLGTQPSMRRV
jgi:hypothetical protein